MKRTIVLVLILSFLLPCLGCEQAPVETTPNLDISGKYLLNTSRNEAIIDDFGMIKRTIDGNARVYYHIFVGSFSDSNGDGIGDLRGIINRFDYLNDGLGVEGIWLSPIFASPSYHKYDTTDYMRIDPVFGTEQDLKDLIALCHERGVQIILDLVINHTSTNHNWFKEFTNAHRDFDTTNPYYDYYSWSEAREPNSTWNPIPNMNGHFYECNFSGDMPELNYNNEIVRQEMVDIAAYYLNMGVDGFRFDAAKYIYYGKSKENTDFWDWYMAQLRAIKPDIYTVAEVWDADSVAFPYFSSTNCFNFSMAQNSGQIAQTAKGGSVNGFVNYVSSYLDSIHAINPNSMMVTFIANHDTDRAAGYLTTATGQAQVAANLSILLPGSTFIYYGEEIGMLGSRGGANTDANRRLAMLWGDGDSIRNPIGSSYTAKQINGTVKDQLPDGNSLYTHYKKLIAIRKANPEIAYGTYEPLQTTGKYGGFLCTYQDNTVAVIHNTTTSAVTIELDKLTDVQLTMLSAVVGIGSATLEGNILTLDGQTSVVLRAE